MTSTSEPASPCPFGLAPKLGRKRDSVATRAAIVQAARRRFASEPFEQVGMREIGADARVDPALIVRYFGSKEELFKSILDDCKDAEEVWSGDRGTFGERVAREIASDSERSDGFEDILIALRATASPRACGLAREAFVGGLLEPMAAWLGGRDAVARARMLTVLFMGGVVTLAISAPDEPERQRFLRRLADNIQAIVDEDA